MTESVQNRNNRIIDDFRAHGGNVHSEGFGRRLVLVHHLGARTGTEYVTPLVSIRDDEDTWLIAASDGGARNDPQWYRNLLTHPDTKIETPDGVVHVHVEDLADAARDAAWAQFTSATRNVEHENFRRYQRKTDRTIPVVALRRSDQNQ